MKRTLFASKTALALTTVLFVSQLQLFAQQGTWVAKAPMPTARMGIGTSLVNGVIYSVGGFNNGTIFGVVEAYDPASDTWTTKASMPTARRLLSTSVVNGVIYAVGGDNGSYLGTVEAYDPASNTWTTKASMPTPRHQLSTSVVNGVIYAMGGTNGVTLGTVEAYDPASDTWTTKASMPTARFGEGSSVVNGLIYAIGGTITGGSGFLGTVEAYDPASDTWTTKASMPTARQNLSASVVNGVIYGVGGYNGSLLGTVEAYDPLSDTWATKAAMPTPRYELSTSAVNGVIYAIGGAFTIGTFGQLATVEAFTPASTPPLVGDGSAITNLTAANISSGTAGINITGNAATATSASGLTCTGCVGNTQLGINYAGSASQGGPATSALNATLANQATNSLSLGGILATNFARLDIGNSFTGNQSVAGNLAIAGTVALGGGTPILKHLSLTVSPTFPALGALVCRSANFTFTGASDGDTIALGVPNSRMIGGGTLNYFAWVGVANTITIRACNLSLTAQTAAGSGAIRVDVWKH